MNTVNWNNAAEGYSGINDARRQTVFPRVREFITSIKAQTLLDYGGGDGLFAASCADLPLEQIVVYDPAPNMARLAHHNTRQWPHITVVTSLQDAGTQPFDIITSHAVWMCLAEESDCLQVLAEIRQHLSPDGLFIASVTHPCFRETPFSTYHTAFQPENYFANGSQFQVTLHDSQREFRVTDTHWNLDAMTRQLDQAGFMISRMLEIPDTATNANPPLGAPWLVWVARQTKA